MFASDIIAIQYVVVQICQSTKVGQDGGPLGTLPFIAA